MSVFSKIVSKAVSVVKDVVKIGIQPVAASVSSITGKKIDLKYDTKVGANVGGVVKVGIDSGHVALKTFADTVTGGYASKAVNLVRDDAHKEKAGSYQEQVNKTFDSGILAKFENVTEKGGVIVGTLGATVLKKPEATNTGIGGPIAVNNLPVQAIQVFPKSVDMGLFDKLNTASQTNLGKALTSVLGDVVSNIVTKKSGNTGIAGGSAAQAAAFGSLKVSNLTDDPKNQEATGAAFGDVKLGGAISGSASDWWQRNKGWIIPVSVATSIITAIIMIVTGFFKRRR